MKIALLGNGKTGKYIHQLHTDCLIFDRSRPPSFGSLKECDIAISFLPADAFAQYLPLLIESQIPLVTGTTGFKWPNDINAQLKNKKLKWIYAHNFSLGMNLVKKMIHTLSCANELFEDADFSIHEVHHTHKKDAPSGTAISFEKWLGHKAKISSERTGDVVGIHELTFESEDEKIVLKHKAKHRRIFARGALWAAKILNNDGSIDYGLNDFNDIVNKHLNI